MESATRVALLYKYNKYIYIYIDSPSFVSNPDIIIYMYISIVHIVVYIFSICVCRFACDSSKDSIYAIQRRSSTQARGSIAAAVASLVTVLTLT